MKTLTKAERAKMTAALLYPEDEDINRYLSLPEVAAMTNRNVRVLGHFIRKGILPAIKQDGKYLVKMSHVGIVLWQPAWNEKSRLDKRHSQTVVPGTTPEPTL